MPKCSPYHTNSTSYSLEHREVYHDHSDCPYGRRIELMHRESGTAARPRCKECKKLD
jgi:hypothetical protein